MTIGDKVKVNHGATRWLKSRDHWDDYIDHDIDEMVGVITDDYSHLSGDDSHFCVELGFDYVVGIPERLLEL